ncbi:MAG: hypothetical protein NTZ87_01895 [Candidatus Nomurabacteria bacterium]|nr:hypothetical protein [Candidatus Nomurabacteria bacterium]
MEIKKLQKNKACPHYYAKRCRRGFVILFAVTLAAILLSIAIGVTNVALKEIKFSTSAKGTNDAFFAADTGIECALVNDKSTINSFTQSGGPSSIQCIGLTITLTKTGTSLNPVWDFVVPSLGSSSQSCAKVKVTKDFSLNTAVVVSKGYNNGSGGDPSNWTCSNTNNVERELQVSY